MVLRSVCWRAGTSLPTRQDRQPWQNRARSACGGSTLLRVAANSIASGNPSRRAQISAMAGAWRESPEVGLGGPGALEEKRHGLILGERREIGQVPGIGQRQRGNGKLLFGTTRNVTRLVTRIFSRDRREEFCDLSAAPTTCSKLSNRSNSCCLAGMLAAGRAAVDLRSL